MNEKIGTFKIETSFNISDRGIIVVCQHVEGIVKIGSVTNVEFQETFFPARIIGIERGNIADDGVWRLGLLLAFDDDAMKDRIAAEKLKEQTIEIFFQ